MVGSSPFFYCVAGGGGGVFFCMLVVAHLPHMERGGAWSYEATLCHKCGCFYFQCIMYIIISFTGQY